MKTTIDIADNLLRAAKETAGREGTTVRALVEEGLRRVLPAHGKRAPFHLRETSFRRGRGLQPQVREGSWAAIRELAYEGRGG
jgi:hypothetical protein